MNDVGNAWMTSFNILHSLVGNAVWNIIMTSNNNCSDGYNSSNSLLSSSSSSSAEEVPQPNEPSIIEGCMACWCNGCKGSYVFQDWIFSVHIKWFGQYEGHMPGGEASSLQVDSLILPFYNDHFTQLQLNWTILIPSCFVLWLGHLGLWKSWFSDDRMQELYASTLASNIGSPSPFQLWHNPMSIIDPFIEGLVIISGIMILPL